MEFEQFSVCSFYSESVSKGFFFGQRQSYVQQVFLNSPELFLCSFGMLGKPGAYVPFRMCQVRCRPTM